MLHVASPASQVLRQLRSLPLLPLSNGSSFVSLEAVAGGGVGGGCSGPVFFPMAQLGPAERNGCSGSISGGIDSLPGHRTARMLQQVGTRL